jgi:hypothetical protein
MGVQYLHSHIYDTHPKSNPPEPFSFNRGGGSSRQFSSAGPILTWCLLMMLGPPHPTHSLLPLLPPFEKDTYHLHLSPSSPINTYPPLSLSPCLSHLPLSFHILLPHTCPPLINLSPSRLRILPSHRMTDVPLVLPIISA